MNAFNRWWRAFLDRHAPIDPTWADDAVALGNSWADMHDVDFGPDADEMDPPPSNEWTARLLDGLHNEAEPLYDAIASRLAADIDREWEEIGGSL